MLRDLFDLENQNILHSLQPENIKKNLRLNEQREEAELRIHLGSDSSWREVSEPRLCDSTMPLYQIILDPGFRDDVGPIYNSIFWISPSNPSFTF